MKDKTHGADPVTIIKTKGATVDESIARTAQQQISDVVSIAEGNRFMIGMAKAQNAADYLVARLFTDAIFSQDIRSIQLIINRIDGGLPKDTEVAIYQTQFGDCLNEIMGMERKDQLMVYPTDSVMMALCKSLYQLATKDIYWDAEKLRSKRPSDSEKKERDTALRMVLERTGGRKTLSSVPKEHEEVEIAPWIAQLQAPSEE